MINIDEINSSVQSFKDTIESLKTIDAICDITAEQLDSLNDAVASLKPISLEIIDKSIELSDESRSIKECVAALKVSNEQIL